MAENKTGRNDPCPCGSGKKFKNCCQPSEKQQQQAMLAAVPQALRSALNYHQAGRIPQAEAIYHQILRVVPNHPDALHLLGAIALQGAKIDEAISLLRQALKGNPKNPECYSNLGLALQYRGELQESIECFQKAVAIKPDYADAWYNLHALLIDPGNMQPSLACMQRVVALRPNDLDARLLLGVLLDYTGRSEEAQAQFEKISADATLYQARLDAWRYMKEQSKNASPLMTGSNIQAFQLGFRAANADGLVLEFGVRHGTSIRQIAKLAKQPVHGFDSFEGLPEVWHHEPKGSYTTKGEIPNVPGNVHLHVGWFEDTLPTFLEQHAGPVRFINVDCDIYSSTKTILDSLAPRMVAGSVIVFDEYIGNEHWREDEFKAFQEAVAQYGWTYEYLCFSLFTKQVAVRLLSV